MKEDLAGLKSAAHLFPPEGVVRLLLDHIETLEARVATLSVAVEPFAAACSKHFNDTCPDETPAWWDDNDDVSSASSVTVGDFRAAREAAR